MILLGQFGKIFCIYYRWNLFKLFLLKFYYKITFFTLHKWIWYTQTMYWVLPYLCLHFLATLPWHLLLVTNMKQNISRFHKNDFGIKQQIYWYKIFSEKPRELNRCTIWIHLKDLNTVYTNFHNTKCLILYMLIIQQYFCHKFWNQIFMYSK